jgi:hypothetical protein
VRQCSWGTQGHRQTYGQTDGQSDRQRRTQGRDAEPNLMPGVSQVVERVMRDLQHKYNVDSRSPVVGIVRLTGLMHADDRVAFREAARQLCAAFNLGAFVSSASFEENIIFLRDVLQELQR